MKKQIALVVGHEPGGGAKDERDYNSALAVILRDLLIEDGYEVYIHKHVTRPYGRRQDEMREAVQEYAPDAECCIELHYNSYSNPSANGHEYLYRGSKRLAQCFRDAHQDFFPWSKARADNGIKHQPSGNGAGFLKKSPSWACLVEPFFESNPKERDYFFGHMTKLAECYRDAVNRFCG